VTISFGLSRQCETNLLVTHGLICSIEAVTQSDIAPVVTRNFLRQPSWVAAILITLIIVGFHFYFLLHVGGFWRDEVNLINVAGRHSIGKIAADSFPVLMPLLVKIWCSIGLNHDEVYLRLLGIFIGLGSVAALWLAAWTARRAPPLVSLALFGLNSTVITFGDSIRAYGLGSLMVALTAAAAWMFLKKVSWKRAGIVAALAVLSVQSLYHNAVLVGAICLGTTAVCARRKDWLAAIQILTAGALAAISLLPYVPNFLAGQETTAVLRIGMAWPRFFGDLTNDLGFPWRQYNYVWGSLALLAVVCAGLVLRRSKSAEDKPVDVLKSDEVCLFAATTLLLGAGGFLFFLWVTAMPGQPWYFLPIMILSAMCFDAVCSTLPSRARAVLLAGVIATVVVSLPVARRDLDYRFTNIDTWSRGLTAEASPEDFILVMPWFYGITFDHYFHGATPWTTIPPLTDHSTHRYDLVRVEIQETNVMRPVLEKITATLQSGHRVWLFAPLGLLKIPVPGTLPPVDLPPAPLPGSGWADDPYSMVWSMQAMQFISSNSRLFGLVKNPNAGQRIAENMELFLAEGWKNSPAPPPNVAGRFIFDHSLHFEPVDADSGLRVNDLEDLKLMMADGWKDFAATNSQIKTP
jgi:hypothetical protein